MKEQQRKNIRLKHFDYTQNGAYFVTICTKDRKHTLGNIVGGDPLGAPCMCFSATGEVVAQNIEYIKNNVKNFDIDCFCIMPNHIHLIIQKICGAPNGSPPTTEAKKGIQSIPQLVSVFKRFSNKQAGRDIFQRSYYEHVIRSEDDLNDIRKYISENPSKWAEDKYFAEDS